MRGNKGMHRVKKETGGGGNAKLEGRESGVWRETGARGGPMPKVGTRIACVMACATSRGTHSITRANTPACSSALASWRENGKDAREELIRGKCNKSYTLS